MVFLATLIASLLDPVRIVLAAIGGLVSRSWGHVVLASLVVSGLVEALLTSMQVTRTFQPMPFLAGFLASFIGASLAFYIKKRLQQKAQQAPD